MRAQARAPGGRDPQTLTVEEVQATRMALLRDGDTRARALLASHVRAALELARQLGGDEQSGGQIVAGRPWLAEVPIVLLAREAARLWMPSLDLRLSVGWQRKLEAAAKQLDRYGHFGAGRRGIAAAVIIDLVRGGWEGVLPVTRRGGQAERHVEDRGVRDVAPYSLGGIAVCARRLARRWRYHERHRRATSAAGQAASLPIAPGSASRPSLRASFIDARGACS